jgi:thymidine kinase
MYHGSQPGWIEVITGVMFSGKSEELIRRVRRAVIARQRVQVFKSHLDDRYGGVYSVSTHDGTAVEAEPINLAADVFRLLRPDTTVVAIDEVQFLDDGILGGTETDFRGEPFRAMPDLMAIAEVVDKLQAICVVCGGPACRNQRLVDGEPAYQDSPTIMVGGRETYEARCRHCHVVVKADRHQTSLL